MPGLCEGRVVIVTGAARGIGRGHALEFARQGAKVVVNDTGGEVDGTGTAPELVEAVVDEIRKAGGEATANTSDVSDWGAAEALVQLAVETYGGLDVVVTNAGILRDRMLTNMTAEEWDGVIQVHLRGTFAPMHFAAAYWRDRSKAGEDNDGRIITTSSASGLYGNVGQTNYGAAKAGIAAMTIIAAQELARYGVTANAIAPAALSRMTDNLMDDRAKSESTDSAGRTWVEVGADNIAPLVVWLGSSESRGITGRVFNVRGGHISVAEGWVTGPAVDKGARWEPEELGSVIPDLVAKAAPNASMRGTREPAAS